MRNLVPLLTARGTDANAEEADLLRDEVQRLYGVASDLRAAVERQDRILAAVAAAEKEGAP